MSRAEMVVVKEDRGRGFWTLVVANEWDDMREEWVGQGERRRGCRCAEGGELRLGWEGQNVGLVDG